MSEPGSGGDRGTPRLGSMFGRYRIESVVGRGGMGVVVRATDTELGRIVVLKFLAPELQDDPRMRERFLREPRLAAAIEHPNIVPIHEAGELDGTPYIAMRAIPGSDLAAILRREAPLAVDRTAAILAQLADALDAAHRRGLVHRDVKPGNVLIEPGEDGAPERAWLTDFGLTRRAGDGVTVAAAAPAGTLHYLAPELISGGAVGPWTDQYALACLAFECLTGSAPWDGPTDAAVLHGHVAGDRAALIERLPNGPPATARALERALAIDPDQRFRDCRAFAAAFTGIAPAHDMATPVAPASATLPDATPAQPIRARSGRQVLAVVLAIGAILVGAGALAAINRGQSPPPSFVPAISPSAPAPSPWVMGGDAEGVIVFSGGQPGRAEAKGVLGGPGELDLWAMRPGDTEATRLTSDPGEERFPTVSPDGTWIVYAAGAEGERDLWLLRLDGSRPVQLTKDKSDDYAPALSPDGTKLAWTSTRTGTADIMLMEAVAGEFLEGRAENLTAQDIGSDPADLFPAWSADGTWIAYASNRGESSDIWRMDPDRPAAARPLTDDVWSDVMPAVDPDGSIVFKGRRVDFQHRLYRLTESGRVERLAFEEDVLMPDIAPDGKRIVAVTGTLRNGVDVGRSSLVLLDPKGQELLRMEPRMRVVMDPDWVEHLVLPPIALPDEPPTTEPS